MPPVAGLLLDWLEPYSGDLHIPHAGYRAIFALATIFLILAAALVTRIQLKENDSGAASPFTLRNDSEEELHTLSVNDDDEGKE